MRRIAIFLVTIIFSLLLVGSSFLMKTRANAAAILFQSPNRCTSLKYGPKPKEKAASAATSAAVLGTRCARLYAGGRPGTVLPNTAPNVGIATSTASIAGGAPSHVDLKAIACDADKDTLLYTFSSTGGRITGEGATAIWDLTGVIPGTYTVSVEVDDGCGCISFDSSSVTLE